jgi:dTDP-4-amino-4,6-dideoxygalactose transaminase
MPNWVSDALALNGGPPTVTIPSPHFRWPLIAKEDEQAVLKQLRSGELSLPRRAGIIEELESNFAQMHERTYAMSTSSGTSALHAAYFGLDLEPGDEILAPAYTHLATVLPMLHAGLIPVLCEVEEDTGNIDVRDASTRLTSRTRAIAVTHQYGHICNMEAVLELASQRRLFVIEDCSHAHGASFHGRLAGTFGDVACFSLQAHKAMVAGEGGILLTSNPRIFERATLLGHFREKTAATSDACAEISETGYGLKNRMHPLGAALAVSQLRRLPKIIEQRRLNLCFFEECLKDVHGVRALPTRPGVSRGGYFRFLVKYIPEELNGLPIATYMEALRAEGVREMAAGSLAKPLHFTQIFQTLEDGMYRSGWPRRGPHVNHERVYRPGDFPRAERFSALTIQFPAFTEPSKQIIAQYCQAMKKVARHSASLIDTVHAA